MHQFHAQHAVDLARERIREADESRLAALARAGQPTSPSRARRLLAAGLLSMSRASARVVRRLDPRLAEDLARPLIPAK